MSDGAYVDSPGPRVGLGQGQHGRQQEEAAREDPGKFRFHHRSMFLFVRADGVVVAVVGVLFLASGFVPVVAVFSPRCCWVFLFVCLFFSRTKKSVSPN